MCVCVCVCVCVCIRQTFSPQFHERHMNHCLLPVKQSSNASRKLYGFHR